jgi:hypothetical protein
MLAVLSVTGINIQLNGLGVDKEYGDRPDILGLKKSSKMGIWI